MQLEIGPVCPLYARVSDDHCLVDRDVAGTRTSLAIN
jgi:hypothetical protein